MENYGSDIPCFCVFPPPFIDNFAIMATIFVMEKERCILHCDLNNFYASVECLLNPSLKGYCVAVTGDQDMRHGIVLAKSNEAKAAGVKTAEAIWQARKKCPDLICVPPHYDDYVRYSKQVKSIYLQYSDKVESFSLDECWIDVSESMNLFGDGKKIADEIRERVKAETGLTISVGVSFTKSFAKLGSDMKKPDATTVISKENFRKTVWNLDVGEMLMIGRKTAEKLNRYNIFTIGQLAKADDGLIKEVFGVNGIKIIDAANGRDFTPVGSAYEERDIKSVGHGTTAAMDVKTVEDASSIIYFLCEMISTRMRRYKVVGKTVSLDMRNIQLEHLSRQKPMPKSNYITKNIAKAAVELLKENWKPEKDLPLRTITVAVSNLEKADGDTQQDFFAENSKKDEKLEGAMDVIRGKYGFDAISRGNYFGSDFITDKKCGDEDLLPFKRG